MAINLLPGEEKLKADKRKYRATPQIEMTGPVGKGDLQKAGKQKAGGVLMFVKEAFRRPDAKALELKKQEEAKRRKGSMIMPAKKVLLTEKITYIKQKPKVEYVPPKPVPEKSERPKKKQGSFFSRLFGRKKIQKEEIKKPSQIFSDREQFPKYRPVRAEKILPQPESKKVRNGDVIVVTKKEDAAAKAAVPPVEPQKPKSGTADGFPATEKFKATLETEKTEVRARKPEEKKKKKSAWQRFSAWFKKLFDRKKITPVAPPPPKKPDTKVPSPLKDEYFSAQKEIKVTREETVQKPVPPEPKNIPSAPEPTSDIPVQIKKEIPLPPPPLPEVKKEEPQKETIKPAMPVPPAPPVQKQREVELPEIKEAVTEPVQEKKKRLNFSAWLKKVLASIKKIFARRKKEPKPIPKMSVPKSGHKISFTAPKVPLPPLPKQKIETPTPPPIGSVMPDDKSIESEEASSEKFVAPSFISKEEKKQDLDEAKIIKDTKAEEPKPEHHDKKGAPDMTQPEEPDEEGSGFSWDVNLVPEDIIEQEIPVSKFLYLVLYIIVSCGVVFGGWLWASWYYTNIATNISEVESKIESKQSEINMYESLQFEVQQLNARVRDVSTLLSQHVYWSQIFSKLEQHTISEVHYTSMTADVNGSVKLTAVGKDYESAIKQLLVYEKATEFVTAATISQVTYVLSDLTQPGSTAVDSESEQVTFLVDLTVHPTIFYYNRQ